MLLSEMAKSFRTHTMGCHVARPPAHLAVTLMSLLFLGPSSAAITFMNPDLEGTPGQLTAPPGWSPLTPGASYTAATSLEGFRPFIVSATGPFPSSGVDGNPNSGATFVAAADGLRTMFERWQQGIEQEVTGFSVGQEYTFSFFQGVMGYDAARIDTGAWSVHANGALISATTPSVAAAPWSLDRPIVWEQRNVTFTATSDTIRFAFVAKLNFSDITRDDRMMMIGIDSFSEIKPVPEPSAAVLGFVGALGLLRRRRA